VYRHNADHARVLSHQLLKRFGTVLPDNPAYGNLDALHFFNGMPVENFIRDYRQYAAQSQLEITRLRPIPIRYAAVEEGLVGNIPGINSAVLRLFLMRGGLEVEDLLRQSEPFYELPPEEARTRFQALAQPFLEAFYLENKQLIENSPLYRLFKRFG